MSDESRSRNQADSLQRKMDQADTKMYRIDRAHCDVEGAPPSDDGASSADTQTSDLHCETSDLHCEASNLHCEASNLHCAATDEVKASGQIVDYDFRHPTPVSRQHLRSLHTIHQRCAESFNDSAGELLRSAFSCELTDVFETSYCEYVYSLDDPTCFYLITPHQIDGLASGQWMLDVSPRLAFAMVDRMLGGEPNPAETIHRELTDIEARLMKRVIDRFLHDLKSSWQKITTIDPVIAEPVVRHPIHGRHLAANDRAARVNFAVNVSGVSGKVSLLVPLATIEHLHGQLSEQTCCDSPMSPTEQTRSAISDQLATAPIEVVVNLAHSTIRTDDLLDLSVGDIIATEKESTGALELSIQNVPKFKASPGAFRGKKAVRIESSLDKPESQHHESKKLDNNDA